MPTSLPSTRPGAPLRPPARSRALALGLWAGLGAGLPAGSFAQAPLEQIAHTAVRGDTPGARAALRPLLRRRGRVSPQVAFLGACVELSAGELAAADRHVKQLLAQRPDAAEARVLSGLVEQRRSMPARSWPDSFAEAWKLAGRPEAGEPLLPFRVSSKRPLPELPPDALRGLPAELLVPYAATDHPERLAGLAIVLAGTGAAAEVKLVALTILTSARLPEVYRARARGEVHRLFEELTAAHPDQVYLALWAELWDSPGDRPFSEDELKRLERAIERADPGLPVRSLFEAFGPAIAKVDPGQAHERAWAATGRALPLAAYFTLAERAARTAQRVPQLAERAARLLMKVGDRLSGGKSLAELRTGVALLDRADRLDDRLLLPNRAYARRRLLRELSATDQRMAPLTRLPIPELRRELIALRARDELAFIRRFAR